MYNTYYIYIMSSLNNTTLYIGVTNDLERRVKEHKSGEIPGFTQKYNCCKLVYFEEYSDIDQAIEREKKLKKWRREKKDWLIRTKNPGLIDLAIDLVLQISRLASLARNDREQLEMTENNSKDRKTVQKTEKQTISKQ